LKFWDVVRHQGKYVLQISGVSCVLTAHDLPFKDPKRVKTTQNVWVLRRFTPTKKFIFFNYFGKVMAMTDVFM